MRKSVLLGFRNFCWDLREILGSATIAASTVEALRSSPRIGQSFATLTAMQVPSCCDLVSMSTATVFSSYSNQDTHVQKDCMHVECVHLQHIMQFSKKKHHASDVTPSNLQGFLVFLLPSGTAPEGTSGQYQLMLC